MNLKKTILSCTLALALLLSLGFSALAADTDELPQPQPVHYTSFTGTVTTVDPFYDAEGNVVEGKCFVYVRNAEEAEVKFIVDEDTYLLTDNELAVGATVTGYYLYGLPMVMIYPPQHTAKALAVDYDGEASIFVDRFDDTLLSADGSLHLQIGEHTRILDEAGELYNGESFANKPLVIFYHIVAQSHPAQTTPEKIIVLRDDPQWPKEPVRPDAETIQWLKDNVPNMDIVVEGQVIDAPAAYADDNGTIMVPIRAIAEALDYEVVWLHESRGVSLDGKYTFYIGQDSYSVGKIAPQELGTAPVLVDSRTYVPLSFFRDIMAMNNAYCFESQIVINNEEKME